MNTLKQQSPIIGKTYFVNYFEEGCKKIAERKLSGYVQYQEKSMKEPMKCEQITSTYYTSGVDMVENKVVCGGELKEKGSCVNINNEAFTIYQCKVCRDVVIK